MVKKGLNMPKNDGFYWKSCFFKMRISQNQYIFAIIMQITGWSPFRERSVAVSIFNLSCLFLPIIKFENDVIFDNFGRFGHFEVKYLDFWAKSEKMLNRPNFFGSFRVDLCNKKKIEILDRKKKLLIKSMRFLFEKFCNFEIFVRFCSSTTRWKGNFTL